MPRREAAPGFSERLKRVRKRLGHDSVAEFARALGLPYMTYRKWEVLGSAPAPHTLKHAIKLLGVQQWELLFFWLCDGVGELPWWFDKEVPVPGAKDPLPKEVLEAQSPSMPRFVSRPDGPMPLFSVEMLAQRARLAHERGDVKEAESAERELINVMTPWCGPVRAKPSR